jgi:membrane protein
MLAEAMASSSRASSTSGQGVAVITGGAGIAGSAGSADGADGADNAAETGTGKGTADPAANGLPQRAQWGQRGTAGPSADVRVAASIGRKVVQVEGQATRAAASTLLKAGHKAAAAEGYVKRHPWRSVLLAASAGLFVVTAVAGRRRDNVTSPQSGADAR